VTFSATVREDEGWGDGGGRGQEFEELQRVQTEFSGKYSIDDEEIAQVYLYLNIYVLNI